VKITLHAILASVVLVTIAACDADDPVPITPPVAATCPAFLTAPATCYKGTGRTGADYLIVMPPNWNGRLILYNRGATPVPFDTARSLGPTRFLVADSVAIAATAYRSATPLAKEATEDVEDLRQIFVATFGAPRHTIAWGLSFGGLVSARCAERYRTFDGALVGCGTIAAALSNYYPLLDLRLTYQYYCKNLPRPNEQQYDLFWGLDPQGTMSAKCAPVSTSAQAHRCRRLSAAQLNDRTSPTSWRWHASRSLPAHQHGRATTLLKILVQQTMEGRNPLKNMGVAYNGSSDDAALNNGIARYTANTSAAASFRRPMIRPKGLHPDRHDPRDG
jgi:pimeloyl-ACP methyl ester carboxylesterase